MSPEDEELEALWIAAFGQPPAIRASAEFLLDHLIRYLPQAPCYAPSPKTVAPDQRAAPDKTSVVVQPLTASHS